MTLASNAQKSLAFVRPGDLRHTHRIFNENITVRELLSKAEKSREILFGACVLKEISAIALLFCRNDVSWTVLHAQQIL